MTRVRIRDEGMEALRARWRQWLQGSHRSLKLSETGYASVKGRSRQTWTTLLPVGNREERMGRT